MNWIQVLNRIAKSPLPAEIYKRRVGRRWPRKFKKNLLRSWRLSRLDAYCTLLEKAGSRAGRVDMTLDSRGAVVGFRLLLR